MEKHRMSEETIAIIDSICSVSCSVLNLLIRNLKAVNVFTVYIKSMEMYFVWKVKLHHTGLCYSYSYFFLTDAVK